MVMYSTVARVSSSVSHIWKKLGAWIREGNGSPLQYSCLEDPMDGGAWWAAVHGVAKSRTRLSNFTFTFHFHALEKETATHSSVLAWRIPGMGEPGGLLSMGSQRVGHDWSDLAVAAAGDWIWKVLITRKKLLWLCVVTDVNWAYHGDHFAIHIYKYGIVTLHTWN